MDVQSEIKMLAVFEKTEFAEKQFQNKAKKTT